MRGRLLYLCVGGDGSGSARRADRREIVAWKGRGAGFARRANRREFVDWCKVWR